MVFSPQVELAGGIVGVEWVVCGVVVGGNGVDLGSRSYFLILGEGVVALPVKIPVFNTDEVGAVCPVDLWHRFPRICPASACADRWTGG